MKNRTTKALAALGATAIIASLGVGSAQAAPAGSLKVVADSYLMTQGKSLKTKDSVFANDLGKPTAIVSHTDPANGSLSLNPDGTFTYVPKPGFTGVDTFTYTASDAVTLYKTDLPPIATIGGVKITGGAYGSSVTPVPGSKTEVYGLTDRGPNVDGPNGEKVEPLPDFNPAIGKFKLVDGKAVLEKTIPLAGPKGQPFNGQVDPQANTGEKIVDLKGKALKTSPFGYDSEGLVALPNGTFWVSDEYGPFVTHFNKQGREIGRLSPFDGSLPVELANRVPNKGMEGLTITPDGKTLVGIMQSALQAPDQSAPVKPATVAPLRIVTYNLKNKQTHEFLYMLDDPAKNAGAVSEITALSNTEFVVDERDGAFEPNAFKKLFKIDISNATDVGPASTVKNSVYNGAKGGLLVGKDQKSIEALVGAGDTAQATAALKAQKIVPVKKSLDLDVSALVTTLDPTGGFFGHDKVEGVATTDHGKTLIISNDNDFGIIGLTNDKPPYKLEVKKLPNGQQDDGEYLTVNVAKAKNAPKSTSVSIFVTPRGIHISK
jgi:hypothetical protein